MGSGKRSNQRGDRGRAMSEQTEQPPAQETWTYKTVDAARALSKEIHVKLLWRLSTLGAATINDLRKTTGYDYSTVWDNLQTLTLLGAVSKTQGPSQGRNSVTYSINKEWTARAIQTLSEVLEAVSRGPAAALEPRTGGERVAGKAKRLWGQLRAFAGFAEGA